MKTAKNIIIIIKINLHLKNILFFDVFYQWINLMAFIINNDDEDQERLQLARNYPVNIYLHDDCRLYRLFRFDMASIEVLTQMLEPYLRFTSNRNRPITPQNQVCILIRIYFL